MPIAKILAWLLLLFLTPYTVSGQQRLQDHTDSLFQVFLTRDTQAIEQLFDLVNSHSYLKLFFRREQLLLDMLDVAENTQGYDDYKPQIESSLGYLYILKGNYNEAFRYLSSAQDAYKNSNDFVALFYALYNLSAVFYNVKDNKNCLKYLDRAEQYVHHIPIRQDCAALINLYNMGGLVAKRLKLYDDAIIKLEKGLRIAEQCQNTFWIGLMNGNIGSVYFEKGEYDKALPRLKMDATLSLQHKEFGSAANAESQLLKIYLLQNNHKAADFSAHHILFLLDSLAHHPAQRTADPFEALSTYYESKGDFAQALYYKKYQSEFEKNLAEQQKTEEVNRLQTAFDYQKQEQIIVQQELEIDSQRFFIYIVATIMLFLFSLLTLGVVFYSRQKKMLQTIQHQNIKMMEQFEALATQRTVIEEQNKKMQELMGVKDKIFSVVSHDLRNPIGNLKLVFDMFEQEDLSPEELKEMVGTMKPQISGLYDMMNNLLVWANIQIKSGLNASPQMVLLLPIVTEVKNLYWHICQKKQIDMVVQIAADTTMRIDENHLKVILRNLVSNAFKFTNPNGTICIAAQHTADHTTLLVTDSGVGMSTEEQTQLFQTHFTKRGTQNERGTGLGLLLVKDFVEANGGKLLVESQKNKGTTFSVVMPNAALSNE